MAVVTLSQEHFDGYVRRAQAAELKVAQMRLAATQGNQELAALVAKRDAYYADLAGQYPDLPASLAGCTTIRWDEAELRLEVA